MVLVWVRMKAGWWEEVFIIFRSGFDGFVVVVCRFYILVECVRD